ncbi:hypothetical protein L1887_37874 [Cichorium endivia]|nr:hypothetical protein L1887_37874 [Cichorium endivia]
MKGKTMACHVEYETKSNQSLELFQISLMESDLTFRKSNFGGFGFLLNWLHQTTLKTKWTKRERANKNTFIIKGSCSKSSKKVVAAPRFPRFLYE